LKKNDINNSILHFEQVLKFSDEKYYSGNALYEMSKIRIKQQDFYEAFFTLQRAIDKNFKSQRLLLYKDFTEGVLYLIKRQGDKGVEILSQLLENLTKIHQSSNKVMIPTVNTLTFSSHIYRAYGYLFNGKYSEGYKDLMEGQKISELDKASDYNLIISKGVLWSLEKFEYMEAHDLFESAKAKFPDNKDPYLLQSLNIMNKWYKDHPDQWIDDSERRKLLMMAKSIVDEAIDKDWKLDSVIYYYRGLLHYYLHCFYEALLDFEMAIDKDDEPGAWLYLARGRSFAWLSMLNEAIKDFSIAINLDEKCIDAYLWRGKCSYLIGNNTQAFMDFQKLIVLDSQSPKVHIHAGNLLMTTGAYSDATKAYINADVVENTSEAAFHRARWYTAMNRLDEAWNELKRVIDLSDNERLAYPDLGNFS
jgi:tetratricopeptide (TPR) repeat protein